MIDSDRLFENADPEFEESIRIDRELETDTHADRLERRYSRYLDRYYLTEASVDFLTDLFAHLHDDRPAPDERNHWLYGYYGSGKSHLLTALDLLLDSRALADQPAVQPVWQRFDDRGEHAELGDAWAALHDDVVVVPLSINLLKYQGVRDQSFSEIILQTVYRERGFADRLDVAFFEEEFQRSGGLFDTTEVWENREALTNEILREEGVTDPEYDWDDVREYRILSDIVLEGLTERATGMTENLEDIQNRNIGQELAVSAIESYRQELQAEFDRTVKIVLLMDEVTLFIGGNYQRLSELNALAESISDIGQGNIVSVVTAQSNIEDVQPGLATKQLDFGILKDRFPQQYELPSRDIGEIVQRRLLTKSFEGREWIEDDALSAPVHPETMLTFRDVTQNTEPPLDSIDRGAFIEYYPLLPYQPALFMEILSNLRDELPDASKSIFSGTARAILALVAGLRADWAEKDGTKPIVSLVDFYDLVQYELEDIIPEKTSVIEDIEQDTSTTAFDVRVAKAVLLLSYVPDMVPQTEANIAAAVMDDLEGPPRANLQPRVRESLDEALEKYIRPDTSTDGGELRLTDQEEQQLISTARRLETDPDWDQIIAELDDRLWADILAEQELPQSHDYEGDAYPVGYTYEVDGQAFETGDSADAVFEVDVVVRGLRPDVDNDHIAPDTLYWMLETEGIDELRSQLTEWWALIEATRSTNPPESLVRDRQDAADRVVDGLTTALSEGSFRVEASEFSSIGDAVADYIDEAYPPYFHPELSRIDNSHLDELRQLEDGADLPEWARSIGVPEESTTDFATFSDLAFQLRKLVGTELQEGEPDLDLATVLDRVGEQEPLFATDTGTGIDPAPAALAVLWGLCRAGVFRVTTLDGEPVANDTVLSTTEHTRLTLTPVPPGDGPKDVFIEYDIIDPTASVNQGYVNFDALLGRLADKATALEDDVTVRAETTFETEPVTAVVHHLGQTLSEVADALRQRRDRATTDDVEQLREMLDATREAESLLETVESRWDERLAFLLQLEGFVRLGTADIAWLDEEVHGHIEALREQLADVEETDWWTNDGWPSFVSALDARRSVRQALQDGWETHRSSTDLDAIRADLEGHPWLVGPMELPAYKVHDGFQSAYLDPLRGFRQTIDRIAAVLEPLTDPEPSRADEDTLVQAIGALDDGPDWSVMTATTVSERREQLATLDSMVEDLAPDDVVGIGVLHDDADALREQINGLDAESGSPRIIEHDAGVIVR